MIFDKRRIPKHLLIQENDKYRKKKNSWKWLWSAFLLMFLSLLLAKVVQANSSEMDSSNAGMLFFINQYGEKYQSLHLNSKVDIEINGMIATTKLTQSFSNDSDHWLEGVYVFPLPENSAVNQMEMIIGDRHIKGEIKERQEARKIYQQAKKEGKKAALTEQQRPNLFTQRVANIAPKSTISVTITYIQNVDYSTSTFSIRFPMTITPRYIPGNRYPERIDRHENDTSNGKIARENNFFDMSLSTFGWGFNSNLVSDANEITPLMYFSRTKEIHNPITINIKLNTGLPLASIQSAYHDILVRKNSQFHDIQLQDGVVSMDRDFVLTWQAVESEKPQSALFVERLANEDFAMIMMLPPKSHTQNQKLSRDMIFVIDTSGSMGGTSIEQAKNSLSLALSRLTPNDRFNVIEFNSYHSALYASLTQATKGNILQAQNWIKKLIANGGTNMLPALKTGLNQFGNNETLQQLVFITDGAIGNEKALFNAIHDNLNNARLFTIGIGSSPNSFFMRKAAEFGKGTFTYIGQVGEIAEKMSQLFTKLESAIAGNITIEWPNDSEFYPKQIPDLYHGEPLIIAAKLKDLSGTVKVSGYNASGNWSSNMTLQEKPQNSGVSSLWARRKIESLFDEMTLGGNQDKLKEEITKLGILHKLITKFTSFVAVEKIISRYQSEDLLSTPILNNTPHGQKALDGTRKIAYPNTATSAEISFWIGSFLFLISILSIRCFRDKK